MSNHEWKSHLDTKRLHLRPLEENDIEFIFNHFSDEEVCRYLLDAENFKSVDEAKELVEFYQSFELKDHNRWGIELKTTGELIGTCGFHLLDRNNHTVEIGYDLSPIYWQKGYMSEVLKTVMTSAFERSDINRIQAFVYTENTASYKLLEKMGFIKEGIIRDKHFYRGFYYDHYCYAILKKAYIKESDKM